MICGAAAVVDVDRGRLDDCRRRDVVVGSNPGWKKVP